MKKLIGAIVLAALVSASAVYAYRLLHPAKAVGFESVVPDSAIYYFSASRLNQKIEEFQNSKFFSRFSKTSFYQKQLSLKSKDLNAIAPLLKNLMDKDAALAVLSLGNTVNGIKPGLENTGDILLLIRIDRSQFPKIKRDIEAACIEVYKGTVVSEKYHGIKIFSFKAAGAKQGINYTLLSDTIAISNSLEGVRKSIALFKNENTQSLANNSDFKNAAARIKNDPLFWGYSNHKNYYADYAKRLEGTKDPKAKIMLSQLKPLTSLTDAVKGVSFYVDYDKAASAFIFKSYTLIDAAKDKSGFLTIIARDKAIDKKSLSLITEDAIGYYIYNQDALKCWDFLMKLASNPDTQQTGAIFSAGMIIKLAESFLGISLKDDLIPLLGDDFGIIFAGLKEAEMSGPMPLQTALTPAQNKGQHILFPQLYFFCGTKDKEKLEKTMTGIFQKIADNMNAQAKAALQLRKKTPSAAKAEQNQSTAATGTETPTTPEEEKPPVTLPVENYKGTPIRYLTVAGTPFPFVQPNYFIIDNYFVFSLSTELTKKVITTYKLNAGSFDLDIRSAAIKNQLPKDYSIISFFDFQRMLKSITQSDTFKKWHTSLAANPVFSSADLDSILTALGTLDQCTFTNHKAATEPVLESQGVLTIKD